MNYIKIPLIYQTFENIEIIFEKKEKNIFEQYTTLRNKYLKVKNLISNHESSNSIFGNNVTNLANRIKEIEKTE